MVVVVPCSDCRSVAKIITHPRHCRFVMAGLAINIPVLAFYIMMVSMLPNTLHSASPHDSSLTTGALTWTRWQRYQNLALLLLVVSLVIGGWILASIASQLADDAEIIDSAGRQRMLSQKVSKGALALRYYETDQQSKRARRDEITLALTQLRENHQRLAQLMGSDRKRHIDANRYRTLFMRLTPWLDQLEASLQQLLQAIDQDETQGGADDDYLQPILTAEYRFLQLMEGIVAAYSHDSSDWLQQQQQLQGLFVVVQLLLLGVLGLLVFRPAHRWVHTILRRSATLYQTLQERNRELLEQQQLLTLAMDGNGLAFWFFDFEQERRWFSPNGYHLLGIDPDDPPPLANWGEIVHPDDLAALQADYQSLLCGDVDTYLNQHRVSRGDGEWVWLEVHATAIRRLADGSPAMIIGVFEDITARKQMEAELIVARQQAEAANEAKSRFLITMSHEIRMPLNAIIGTVQLLRQQYVDNEPLSPEDLETMVTASNHLLELINDILDFSRIEVGEIALQPRPFLISELMQELQQRFAVAAESKRLQLIFAPLPVILPAVVLADCKRLLQILINLVGNAIKFTPTGSIEVKLSQCSVLPDRRTGAVWIRFEVTDSGIGISPELQARLFQPFQQGDHSSTRHYVGSGLGLVIVDRLVKLMGGKVGLESETGRGTTFRIDLPLVAMHDS